MPFEADRFDGCRADRSLMHVPDPRRALAELQRVARPGGAVVVCEVDFETLVIDAGDRVLAPRSPISGATAFATDGWAGDPGVLPRPRPDGRHGHPPPLLLPPPLALPLLGATTVQRGVDQGALTRSEGQAWLEHLDELQRHRPILQHAHRLPRRRAEAASRQRRIFEIARRMR